MVNIDETIGNIEYEVIKEFNPGIFSISNVYNRGAKKAKYRTLLFIHEDIEFLNKDWGTILMKCFELKNVGVIGVAGGVKKSLLPTGHDQGIDEFRKVFVSHKRDEAISRSNVSQPFKIKTLDGVFLAMTKEIWQEYRFNEAIEGFHFYDLDISLRTSRKYQNYIIPNIPVIHFSIGRFDNNWVETCLKFHKNNYPFDDFDTKEISVIRRFWFKRLLKEDIGIGNRIKFIMKMRLDKKSMRDGFNFILAGLNN